MHSRLSFLAISAGAALLGFALPASAHHGWNGNVESIELTGTVVRGVSLAGPHANMEIRDAEGQVWELTLAPAPRTSRAGLTEDVVPVGAEVTILGQRNNSSNVFEVKTRRVTYDGQNFDVYPVSE
jgi:hypothetical protein